MLQSFYGVLKKLVYVAKLLWSAEKNLFLLQSFYGVLKKLVYVAKLLFLFLLRFKKECCHL